MDYKKVKNRVTVSISFFPSALDNNCKIPHYRTHLVDANLEGSVPLNIQALSSYICITAMKGSGT